MFYSTRQPVSDKKFFSTKVKVKVTRSLTLVDFKGHHYLSMHAKYEAFISHGSKKKRMLKVDNRQTNKQDKNNMPPIIRSGGIKIYSTLMGIFSCPGYKESLCCHIVGNFSRAAARRCYWGMDILHDPDERRAADQSGRLCVRVTGGAQTSRYCHHRLCQDILQGHSWKRCR